MQKKADDSMKVMTVCNRAIAVLSAPAVQPGRRVCRFRRNPGGVPECR